MKFFGKGGEAKDKDAAAERLTRHSSGWDALMKELQAGDELRVLDFGSTSSTNINLITSMGHSIYMADVATPARGTEFPEGDEETAAVERFLDENLEVGERRFDVVLLWDTLDYLPQAAARALVARLHAMTNEGARLLGLFHVKPEAETYRFHMRTDGQVDMAPTGTFPVVSLRSNRQIEELFSEFSGYKFFLAKDNLREVLVTR